MSQGGHRRRVLIIEDNLDAAQTLKDFLELLQHVVVIAENGFEGVSKARAFSPDIVLCDIGLPGMNGYEVARSLRSDERLKDVPLMAVTGYADADDRRQAEEAGFTWHMKKPPCMDTLERIVQEVPRRAPT